LRATEGPSFGPRDAGFGAIKPDARFCRQGPSVGAQGSGRRRGMARRLPQDDSDKHTQDRDEMSDSMTETRPLVAPDTPEEGRKKMALYLGLTLGLIAIDQLTKYIVERSLRLYDPVPVIGDFFRLTYIFNRGAAFGIHLGDWSRIAFSILPVAAAVLLFLMYRQTPWSDRTRLISIALVTGGALGNLIDRIRSSRGVRLRVWQRALAGVQRGRHRRDRGRAAAGREPVARGAEAGAGGGCVGVRVRSTFGVS
jgi:signal peptidase II